MNQQDPGPGPQAPGANPTLIVNAARLTMIAFHQLQDDADTHGATSPNRATLEAQFLNTRATLATVYYDLVKLIIEARQHGNEFFVPYHVEKATTSTNMLSIGNGMNVARDLISPDIQHLPPDEIFITPLTCLLSKFSMAFLTAAGLINSERALYNPGSMLSGLNNPNRSVYFNDIARLRAGNHPGNKIRNSTEYQIAAMIREKYRLFHDRLVAESSGLGHFRTERGLDLYPYTQAVRTKMNEIAAATGMEDILYAAMVEPLDRMDRIFEQKGELRFRAQNMHHVILRVNSVDDRMWNWRMSDTSRVNILLA
ncbi:hypothetical protein QBC34DRAFT_379186 [Podospora aff. communis PSN243]|uniref:Uncharacterized protein n=1 Tax=Podospora aff. communis PSN243 TaxID=3040156 RepID=A0AAV9GPC6_9PEZI|nr:hypothetical protein QBC34DRAFT_379186 [Podospora aff. communis PSN243]